jgi:hypothetical protein
LDQDHIKLSFSNKDLQNLAFYSLKQRRKLVKFHLLFNGNEKKFHERKSYTVISFAIPFYIGSGPNPDPNQDPPKQNVPDPA